MEKTLPLRHVHIFGDESSHKGKTRFMVHGTVSCQEQNLTKIMSALEFPDFDHEFHWKRSGSHLDEHIRFVNAIFDCIRRYGLRFRCIFVNTQHMRHREYNESDPDLGLEKYIYKQLLRYALEYVHGTGRFHVTLDAGREKKFPPEVKCRMLNAGYRKHSGFGHDAFLSVGVKSSKESRMVQAADVLAGAVAWVQNERYLDKDAGIKKERLARRVAECARLPIVHPLAKRAGLERGKDYRIFHYPTYRYADDKGFSIWDFDLTRDVREDQERESKDQLGAIINRQTKFGDLPSMGYHVRLMCAYCNNEVRNDPPDPQFDNHRITAVYRPKCVKCGRPRVVLLHPDTRDGQLLPQMREPS
jgi:hypothetical protein